MSGKPFGIGWVPLLVSACTILLLLLLLLYYHHCMLTVRVLFAREQVQVISSMRDQARGGNIEQSLDSLDYALHYYTTGSKQVSGSPLDEVVETSRKLAIDGIITSLRQKSGADFGNDPEVWLENRKDLVERGRTGKKR